MTAEAAPTSPHSQTSPVSEAWPVPDSHGIDRVADDKSLQALLPLYLEEDLRKHLAPVLAELGPRLGGEMDDWAHLADVNPPVLHHRTRQGRDHQWIEVHPAYRELQRVAFEDLGMHAMSHTPVLGWDKPMPPLVKYMFFYLFAQAEFGLECPVSMTDALTRTLRKFGDQELIDRYLPTLTSTSLETLTQGAMFMTEQDAGSDVGRATTIARDNGDGSWALTGEKWFCSNADAEVTMILARPEGAQRGIKGIGLFLLPQTLPDGTRNSYRIVRLKDKLGTRSMPSGEVSLDGATAYLVGDVGQGFKQMADMVNSSRLSNAVRSAGMMRRAFGESRFVCLEREAFGTRLIDLPLQRRQLAKLLLPAEQGLSMSFHTARVFERADAGDDGAAAVLRILTPIIKLRTTREARKVTADAMEVRGGVGYIEEYGDARTFRDAQLGSIWEGTSNIVALDVVRAAHRSSALKPLMGYLGELIAEVGGRAAPADAPEAGVRAEAFAPLAAELDRLSGELLHALEMLGDKANEAQTRQVATALYCLCSAVFLAWEGVRIGARDGDYSRVVLAAMVVRHRLLPQDPLSVVDDPADLLKDLILQECVDADAAAAYVAESLGGGQ
ncbi:Acyl-CoA dehydrogenase, middle domain [Brevibacterium sp. Mu109]|uniref:acyl-CoA dehydrogenase family protein n=1 Tax=Brevibacterium sp. Mu109 TaxID=1255669 RepID=UPI000C671893|nr:acyl-CoA dehydrogenase family protein [Brevibacterium sp. Mu109]SMX94968.1 Acyl-CoA dehydrogenase, middle domain [Brevibacterium sp. Mu109]